MSKMILFSLDLELELGMGPRRAVLAGKGVLEVRLPVFHYG